MAPKTPGEGNISPESQLNKLREQARSGGGGSQWRPERDAEPNVSIVPEAEGENLSIPHQKNRASITLDLTPDANDKDMEELLGILQDKGIDAALKELDSLNNPHLEDDFHRLLIQYKREGHDIPGLSKKHSLYDALDFVLMQVAIPVMSTGKPGGSLKEIVLQMEQFMLSVTSFVYVPEPMFFKDLEKRKVIHKEHFTMELAVGQGTEEAVFYVAAHKSKQENLEKQLLSVFPHARVTEDKDDYNIFNQFGETSVSYGTYYRPAPFMLKTEGFDYDPMNLTLAAFSKIAQEGEGVAIQVQVAGAGEYHLKRFRNVVKAFKKGESGAKPFQDNRYLKWADFSRRLGPSLAKGAQEAFKEKKKDGDDKPKDIDTDAIQSMERKMKNVIMGVNLRIVTSARTKERAELLRKEIELSFGQYEDPVGNVLKFREPKTKSATKALMRSFIWRTFERDSDESFWSQLWREVVSKSPYVQQYASPVMTMSTLEIGTIFHFALAGSTSSREVRTSGAKSFPAPPGMPTDGILLGRNKYGGATTDIFFTPEDRLRHMYAIGQTGTGKTTFLKNMIIQDIENGDGVCFIDPHGVDVQDILSRIPKERYDDVIYFDPADTKRPMGLNMLEYDPRYPEQKTFVIDEMFQIFKKLYGDVPEAFGPIFEQYFRNAAALVVEDPETGSTLLDIARVLSDEDFRALKLSRSRNQTVNHFWEDIAEQVRGEGDIRNVVPYITSKFDIFLANEIMRPIVGQQRSAFNFKDIMDNRKILLVNLSKGRLGDVNANLLGLVLVARIMMTALARVSYIHTNPPPFYLYMDEFQNITTKTIASILSEARKFNLSLTIAHQYIKQLSDEISKAVFGNVGSMAVFRIGSEDAQFLEGQFKPEIESSDMLHVDNYNAYIKMLAEGKPIQPFPVETLAFRSGDFAQVEALKQMSYQRYGRARETVEAEIDEKYRGMRGK